VADDLRERLYASYVSSGQTGAPDSLAGLAPRVPSLRRLVDRYFPPERDAAIFEVGCGYGALVHVAGEAGYCNVRGVDISAEQVEAAARLGIDGVARGDLMEVLAGIPEASQDAVVAIDVLEHFGKDDLLRFVDAVARVLRPGGRIVLRVPNAESPFFGAIRHGDLTHELAFTRQSLSQLFLTSGFGGVRCYEDDPVPHGAKSLARAALWKLFRTGMRLVTAAETGETGRDAVFTRNVIAVAER